MRRLWQRGAIALILLLLALDLLANATLPVVH